MKRSATFLAVVAATAALSLLGASSAGAEEVDLVIVGSHGGGGSFPGFLAPGSVLSKDTIPANTTYPTSDPVGWDGYTAGASLFRGEISATGEEIYLYCAQILVMRADDYSSMPRDMADVANAGLVARLVSNYYPLTDAPSDVPLDARGGVVQAAIWYFTDGFVVSETAPHHDVIERIVNDTIAQGPLDESTIDLSFSLTGPTGEHDVNEVVGPFNTSAAPGADATFTVDSGTATVFLDEDATLPVPNGTELAVGTPFWVRASEAGPLTVTANGIIVGSAGLYFKSWTQILGEDAQTMVSATAVRHEVSGAADLVFTGTPTQISGELPKTGVEAAASFAAGALLLLGGSAITVFARRRSTR